LKMHQSLGKDIRSLKESYNFEVLSSSQNC
jgi:hypothetical protein